MESKKGLFISLEGIEATGKSTQIMALRESLQGLNYRVLCLREPGGTPIGEELRHTLKHSAVNHNMCAETELFLLNGSRAQLVREKIRPALNAGEIVICDRFYDSTTAYQGYGRGLNLDNVMRSIELAVGPTKPDITFFIDLTPEQSMENIRNRNNSLQIKRDRFEDEAGLPFFRRVYEGYKEIARLAPDRVRIIPYLPGDKQSMQDQMLRVIGEFMVAHYPISLIPLNGK